MISLTKTHSQTRGFTILMGSFFRELSWLFQRGEHVLDPGLIVCALYVVCTHRLVPLGSSPPGL